MITLNYIALGAMATVVSLVALTPGYIAYENLLKLEALNQSLKRNKMPKQYGTLQKLTNFVVGGLK